MPVVVVEVVVVVVVVINVVQVGRLLRTVNLVHQERIASVLLLKLVGQMKKTGTGRSAAVRSLQISVRGKDITPLAPHARAPTDAIAFGRTRAARLHISVNLTTKQTPARQTWRRNSLADINLKIDYDNYFCYILKE